MTTIRQYADRLTGLCDSGSFIFTDKRAEKILSTTIMVETRVAALISMR